MIFPPQKLAFIIRLHTFASDDTSLRKRRTPSPFLLLFGSGTDIRRNIPFLPHFVAIPSRHRRCPSPSFHPFRRTAAAPRQALHVRPGQTRSDYRTQQPAEKALQFSPCVPAASVQRSTYIYKAGTPGFRWNPSPGKASSALPCHSSSNKTRTGSQHDNHP